MSGNKDGISVVQYDERVKRRSLEDPLRQHRRSSIPFVDRKPAVRFIRNIDQRKASVAGPNAPADDDHSKRPILKKSNFPILISSKSDTATVGNASVMSTTNDELENCKSNADTIMDKIARGDRIARGSMDVLTFPTCTRRVEALSRFQGSLTILVCIIDILTSSSEYVSERKKKSSRVSKVALIEAIASQFVTESNKYLNLAKKFLSKAKQRFFQWETLLKKNTDFKIDHSKLNYPIYTHKRMPESVTLFEDAVDEGCYQNFDGYVRISRRYPEEIVSIHCDSSELEDVVEPVNFQNSTLETQLEVINFVTSHGKNLLEFSNEYLSHGLEVLTDPQMDEAFTVIQKKIVGLEYDDTFDPLCSLELKTALGELVARKAELLNTAEQMVQHCKHIAHVSKVFHKFTKRALKGGGGSCGCWPRGSSKKKLLNLLGMVSIDDVTILQPLTLAMAQDVFHMDPSNNANNFVDNNAAKENKE